MKNSLSDLNDYLFETIERLSDDELMEERGEAEIKALSFADNFARN